MNTTHEHFHNKINRKKEEKKKIAVEFKDGPIYYNNHIYVLSIATQLANGPSRRIVICVQMNELFGENCVMNT